MHNGAEPSWRRDVPHGLEFGLRNYWYPLALSNEVPADRPLAVTALGEDLVLWRDSSGNPHTFVDSCPHRAVKLSAGHVLGDRIQCAYHGLEFDAEGRCVWIPWEGDAPEKCGVVRARTYPTAELGGFVWVYVGEVDQFPPPPVERIAPPEMLRDDFVGYGRRGTWETNWLLAWDGTFDPQHNAFLHAGGVTVRKLGGRGGGIYRMAVRPLKNGLKLQRLNPEGGVERELDGGWMLPGMATLVAIYPDGPVVTRSWRFPLDENRTHAVRCSSRRVGTREQRRAWEHLYHTRILPDSEKVNEQDKAILVTQRGLDRARSNEQLLNSDVGIVRLRAMLRDTFLAQQEGRRVDSDPWCPLLTEPWDKAPLDEVEGRHPQMKEPT